MATPSQQQQAAFLKEHEDPTVRDKEVWYPLDANWWESLLLWTNAGGAPEESKGEDAPAPPGPIANSAIQNEDFPLALKRGIVSALPLCGAPRAVPAHDGVVAAFHRRRERTSCG